MLQGLKFWENIYGTHPNNSSIPATYNYYYSRSASTPVANHIFRLDTNTGQMITDGCTQTAQGAYLGEEYLIMTAAGIVTYPRFREVWTISGDSYTCHGSSQVHIPVTNAANNFLSSSNNWSNPGTWDINAVPDYNIVPAVFINRPVNLDINLTLGSDKTIYIRSGGELSIQPGQTLNSNTIIYAEAGALFQNDGQFNSGVRVQGSLTNRGILSPGNAVGTFTIDGNYNATGSAVHAFEISSLSTFDNINITGNAVINGALNISFVGGYVPVLGNTFKILSFNAGTGSFSNTILPSLPPGLYWKLNYNPTDITLEVTNVNTCVPPSTPLSVSGLVNVCAYVGTGVPLGYKVPSDPNASGYLWTVPPTISIINGQGTDSITVTIGTGFTTSANKLIKVKALSTCGNSSEKLFYLSAQLPSTPSPMVASSTNICQSIANQSIITYTIPKVASASSYNWDGFSAGMQVTHPNGTGINDTIVQVIYLNSFTSGVIISVRSVNDCGISGARSLTINRSLPSTPGLISGPTNICPYLAPGGNIVTYSVAPVLNATNYNWVIPVGATDISGQGTNAISFRFPASAVNETIGVSSANGCGVSASLRTLAVARLNPGTPGIIDVIQLQSCPDRQYSYTLSAAPSNSSSLSWTVPAGATIVSGNGTTSIVVSYPPTAINGQVTITGTSNCGSGSTRSTNVKLPACPPIFAGKGSVRPGETSNLIADNEKYPDIRVYPNPTSSIFRVKLPVSDIIYTTARLLNIQGCILAQWRNLSGGEFSFGEKLLPGTYFLEIHQGKRKLTKKLVKLL